MFYIQILWIFIYIVSSFFLSSFEHCMLIFQSQPTGSDLLYLKFKFVNFKRYCVIIFQNQLDKIIFKLCILIFFSRDLQTADLIQTGGMDRPPSPARLAYTSDKHPRHTLEAINVLRKHRELCDVVLIVGSKKIFAHRVILSACSPYFHAMFTGELAESRQTEVTIRDIDETAMELLIDFCYTSNITVEEGNVQTLLPAACLLQLAEIQDVCCEFLKRQLDPSNCLGIRAFADTHACRDLLRIADKFTQHNFQEVKFSFE